MPIEKTITLYKFDELDPGAKERAREWWRECENLDFDPEFVFEDVVRVAEILGIEIDTHSVRLMGGGTRQDPNIYWSGFCCQGDGAQFEGRYAYAKRAHRRIRKYAPQDTTLHEIADALLCLQREGAYQIEARVRSSGSRYRHSNGTTIDVTSARTGNDIEDQIVLDLVEKNLRRFMDWIYDQLQKEYEYRMADEQVDEAIRCNDYTFTEAGRRED